MKNGIGKKIETFILSGVIEELVAVRNKKSGLRINVPGLAWAGGPGRVGS